MLAPFQASCSGFHLRSLKGLQPGPAVLCGRLSMSLEGQLHCFANWSGDSPWVARLQAPFLEKPGNLFGETNKPLEHSGKSLLATFCLLIQRRPKAEQAWKHCKDLLKSKLFVSECRVPLESRGILGGGWQEEHAVLLLPGAV